MVIKFDTIKNQNYKSRVKFWPTEITKDGDNFYGNDLYSSDWPNNFWILSEQYYSISWTLITAAFNERRKWPYADNISSKEDQNHKEFLISKIYRNNWSAPTFLSFAHLSCELAFKAIIFHKKNEIDQMSYPMGHDLKSLKDNFNVHTKNSFENQYAEWEYSENLNEILQDSGTRFIEQRYGNVRFNKGELGTINLCRFIHEKFELENIPTE